MSQPVKSEVLGDACSVAEPYEHTVVETPAPALRALTMREHRLYLARRHILRNHFLSAAPQDLDREVSQHHDPATALRLRGFESNKHAWPLVDDLSDCQECLREVHSRPLEARNLASPHSCDGGEDNSITESMALAHLNQPLALVQLQPLDFWFPCFWRIDRAAWVICN